MRYEAVLIGSNFNVFCVILEMFSFVLTRIKWLNENDYFGQFKNVGYFMHYETGLIASNFLF